MLTTLLTVALLHWVALVTPGLNSVQLTPMAAFRLGLLTNIMNPKSVLFFGSVFATALPSMPSTPVLVAAVVLAYLNALSWHLLLAVAFSHASVQAAFASHRKVISRIAGAVLGAFGLRLLTETIAELRAKSI